MMMKLRVTGFLGFVVLVLGLSVSACKTNVSGAKNIELQRLNVEGIAFPQTLVAFERHYNEAAELGENAALFEKAALYREIVLAEIDVAGTPRRLSWILVQALGHICGRMYKGDNAGDYISKRVCEADLGQVADAVDKESNGDRVRWAVSYQLARIIGMLWEDVSAVREFSYNLGSEVKKYQMNQDSYKEMFGLQEKDYNDKLDAVFNADGALDVLLSALPLTTPLTDVSNKQDRVARSAETGAYIPQILESVFTIHLALLGDSASEGAFSADRYYESTVHPFITDAYLSATTNGSPNSFVGVRLATQGGVDYVMTNLSYLNSVCEGIVNLHASAGSQKTFDENKTTVTIPDNGAFDGCTFRLRDLATGKAYGGSAIDVVAFIQFAGGDSADESASEVAIFSIEAIADQGELPVANLAADIPAEGTADRLGYLRSQYLEMENTEQRLEWNIPSFGQLYPVIREKFNMQFNGTAVVADPLTSTEAVTVDFASSAGPLFSGSDVYALDFSLTKDLQRLHAEDAATTNQGLTFVPSFVLLAGLRHAYANSETTNDASRAALAAIKGVVPDFVDEEEGDTDTNANTDPVAAGNNNNTAVTSGESSTENPEETITNGEAELAAVESGVLAPAAVAAREATENEAAVATREVETAQQALDQKKANLVDANSASEVTQATTEVVTAQRKVDQAVVTATAATKKNATQKKQASKTSTTINRIENRAKKTQKKLAARAPSAEVDALKQKNAALLKKLAESKKSVGSGDTSALQKKLDAAAAARKTAEKATKAKQKTIETLTSKMATLKKKGAPTPEEQKAMDALEAEIKRLKGTATTNTSRMSQLRRQLADAKSGAGSKKKGLTVGGKKPGKDTKKPSGRGTQNADEGCRVHAAHSTGSAGLLLLVGLVALALARRRRS